MSSKFDLCSCHCLYLHQLGGTSSLFLCTYDIYMHASMQDLHGLSAGMLCLRIDISSI